MRAVVVMLALAACSHPNELASLQAEATVTGVVTKPVLDTLVERVHFIKRAMGSNVPGWETQWRIAELADDQLGLPPLAQDVPPGRGWRPVPTSLLGMRWYVDERATQLVEAKDRAALAFLVSDERVRYVRGLGEVRDNIAEIESWIRTSSSSRRSDSSRPDTSGSIRTSP